MLSGCFYQTMLCRTNKQRPLLSCDWDMVHFHTSASVSADLWYMPHDCLPHSYPYLWNAPIGQLRTYGRPSVSHDVHATSHALQCMCTSQPRRAEGRRRLALPPYSRAALPQAHGHPSAPCLRRLPPVDIQQDRGPNASQYRRQPRIHARDAESRDTLLAGRWEIVDVRVS